MNDAGVDAIAGVLATLEVAAEATAADSVEERFWPEYFRRSPDAQEKMSHMDEYMRGRMLASVYDLLMLEDGEEEQRFLDFEIGNHDAYGARMPMYEALLDALQGAVRHACGERWESAWEQAWAQRTDKLLTAIGKLEHVQ